MANVYIDPFLFACPSIDSTQETFEEYITSLIEWKDLRDNGWINSYILQETVEVLTRNGKYPIYPEVLGLIQRFGIEHIQAGDVVNLVDTYLQRLNTIEENLQINDLLVENVEISSDFPDRNQDFINKLCELFNLIAVKCQIDNEHENLQSILIANYKQLTINYKAELLIIDFNNDNTIECPFLINSNFTACNRFHRLCEVIKPADVWVNSDNATHFIIALKLNTLKMAIDTHTKFDVTCLSMVTFGADFLDNIRHLHFMKNIPRITMILRAMSETILDIALAGTHPLRVGSGANDAQQVAGNFRGWRKDIDYEYHLHYWKNERTIVFANIGEHNSFNISPL